MVKEIKTVDVNFIRKVILPRPLHSHKGNYGRVLLIGGCYPYGGAILMAARSCVYSGAGLVTVATERDNIIALHAQLPEAMAFDIEERPLLEAQLADAEVIVIGPGLGESDLAREVFTSVLSAVRSSQVLIIDGSALTLLAEKLDLVNSFAGQMILTPHQKEWERLSGLAVEDQLVEANLQALKQFPQGSILVAKRYQTQILQLGQTPRQITIGGPYQATGGMGDTLAGMIAGFVGQFKNDRLDAVSAAVYAHSAIAQELSQTNYVTLPSQIAEQIPVFMRSILP
ncbi:NAD(P)H-hydrate dehydratase [Streptococcus merionis]|uniref:NAD(P)H-hydrate dehydratase n=1 Tax=Streptococcus merionis TaxID=400065 RepID=UPI003518D0F0